MSDDAHKSKEQLIKELSDLRQRIAHLEASEASIKQAQANFQDKENQIRQLYETIPLGYQSLDEDGRLLVVNQSWLDTLGYSQDEVIGRWFGDFLSLEEKLKFQKEFPQLKKNGHTQGIAFEIVRQDGKEIDIAIDGRVEYDAHGVIKQIHCILRDITERMDSESAWRESEASYRQIFEEHSSIQILVDPASQQIVDVNPAAVRFYGYTREQMKQMKVSEMNTLPEDEIVDKLTQLNTKQRDYFEVPHRLASGEIRFMEVYAHPIKIEGRQLLYGIFHDVTEHAKVEKALRESSRELFALSQAREVLNSSLDLDQVLTTVLDEVRSLLGVVACSIWLEDPVTGELVCRQVTEPQSQVVRGWRLKSGQGIAGWVAQNGQSLIVPDAQSDKRHFKGVDQQTKLKTRSLLCIPLQVKQQVIGVLQVMDSVGNRFKPADQTLVESLAATAAVAIENARLHERLADHAAEMERRVVERTRELVTANEQLKELDRLKTKLIEDISHELRTPVANLSLYLDLLERGQPEKQEHYKVVLREKMDQLIHLTEDVLNVFRLDLFQGDVVFERIDLNEIVAEVIASYRGEAQLANLDMRFEPEGNLPRVLGERKQVQQIVTSLVDNALNYTSVGSIHIKTCFDVEREQICLGVKDTGMGIASEELPYIFDRFYRGKRVGQLSVPGTGLGLAVVKDIVALHDGVVEVESVVDEGTIFRVWLPVGKDV